MAKIKSAIEEFTPDARLVDERGPTEQHKNKIRPSPINLAVADKRLSREQGVAAEKLYNHWFRGGLSESIGSADLNRVFGGDGFGPGMARTESQAFHRQRFRSAMEKVEEGAGAISAWVLKQIVCHEVSFVEVGGIFMHKRRNTASDVALFFLRPALNILCKEWGVI